MVRKGKASASTTPSQSHGQLIVSAQQSRYYLDCLDELISKEIIVKNLDIAIGQKQILRGAELHLEEGRKYLLTGRNGVGKSSAC